MEAFKFDLMRFSDETLTNGNDYYTDFEEKFAVRILALAGNDHIDLFGSKNLTIDGGTGDDTIENNAETNGENFSINGGAGNDTIINYGNNSTIEGNIGADNIINYSDNSSINGNAGDDTISDCGGIHNTLDGGAGNDTIVTDGSHETLNGGDDDDYIRIFGGELPPNLNGNDRTDNGEYISANGGAGNDTINIIDGSYDTINGGAGDDMISGYTEVGASTVRGDDGNDSIEGVFYGSFIDGGNDADKITVSGSGNTILGGNGNDTIVVGAGGNLSIDGGAGDDNITYVGYCYSNVTISTGGGNDTVQVERTYRNLLIKTDAGNDVVKLNGTVGGYGNPEVTTVEGGAGNDIFYGAKNDSLGTVYHFKTDTGGGGSTIIHNVGNADTVSIDGSYEEINTNSNDLTLRIKATKHEITLKDAKNIGLTIKGTKEIIPPEPPQPPDDPPAPAITSQEVIKRLTFELSNTTDVVGIKQLDRAVVYATGGYYSSAKEVIDDMVRTRSNYPAGTAGSILWMKEKAGIILDNEDTGAIIGSDAGGSRSLNAEDIIPEEGELEDFTGSSFTFNGVKFTLARWKNFASNQYEKISFEDLKTEDQRYMARAIKTWWAREGLNVIKETYGYSFSDSDSTVGEILIMFVNDPNDPSSQNSGFQSNWLQATSYPSYANGKTYTAAITVNLNYYNNFDTANDKNGVSPKGQIHADRCYSHELLHAIMSSVVDYYHNLSAYLKEGLCEVLHGGDFRANSSMIPLANDTDKLRAALNSSSSYAVVDGVHSPSYGGGILFSRFLGKQGSEHYGEQRISYGEEADYSDYINLSGSTLTLKDGFKGSNIDLADYANITRVDATKLKKEIEIIGSSSSNVLQSGEGSDTIHTNNGNNTVSSGAGNDVVYAEGKKTVANLGEGNDTVYSGTGSATLTGGAGSDVFVHAMGDMVIKDYNPGQDKIQLDRYSKIASATVVNGDVNFQVGQASILVKDSAGKKITVIDGEGISSTLIYNEDPVWKLSDTTATYGTSDNTLITLSGVKSLDGLSLNGKVVTVSNTSLDRKDVSISGTGYTLALGNDVAAPVETKAGWSAVDSGKATYNFVSTTAGYKLSNNKISYTKSVAAKSFTFTGIKSTGGITVNGSTVTLTTANLNKKAVTISDGFSIKLANDVSTSSTKTAGAFTKFKSSTATFKTSSFSDFYSLKNNKVTYTAQSGGKTISIKNLKSSATLDEIKSEISVAEQKNGTYKISFKSADVLTSKAPTISAADVTYTVALDKSLKPSALAPDWKISGTNASLKADTSAGYSVSDNKVLYSKKVTGSPQLVLGGLIKNSSLSSPVKKVVTLDSKVLGANSSLKSNAGSYTVKLTGNMSKKTFTGSANADSLNIAANNAAVLGGAGNDYFTVSGSKVTLTGGKGNDSFKLSGKNPVLIYAAGDDNDSVNFVAGMHISLSGSTQIKTLGKSGSDLLLGFGKNSSVKVTGAKSSDTIKVSDANGAVTLLADKFDLADRLTFNSKNSSVTVAKNFTGSLAPSDDIYLGGSKLSKVATINAGNVTSEISISGNAKANFISAGKNNDSILGGNGNDSIAGNAGNDKLYGQNGNDSLSGGKGNDSLWGGDGNDTLTGNDGNDFFIYESGKDVISDYTAGQDKIQIASGKISKTSLSSSDVLFTIGKGSLTVKNAKGKTISLLDSTGKASSTVVGAQALTNSNKASVTIGTDMGAVDASARSKAISITGNALANTISGGTKNDSIFGAAGNDSILGNAGNDKLYGDAGNDFIFGGKGNDSLWGGDGNDSLWGDAGKDTFIYTANEGTDKIFDYETGDLLKILNVDGSYGSFKSSKYSGGDLTLSINGSGKIIFEDVASSTKFNINGSSYNISGSKLVKK